MYDDETEDGTTRTLNAIRAGGQTLIMQARQRVGEVLDAIDQGDFREAYDATQALAAALGPLASAQSHIAIAEGAMLIKVRELEAGMTLVDVGEVTDVEVTECPAQNCKGHVKLKIGEHEMSYRGDVELYVKALA